MNEKALVRKSWRKHILRRERQRWFGNRIRIPSVGTLWKTNSVKGTMEMQTGEVLCCHRGIGIVHGWGLQSWCPGLMSTDIICSKPQLWPLGPASYWRLFLPLSQAQVPCLCQPHRGTGHWFFSLCLSLCLSTWPKDISGDLKFLFFFFSFLDRHSTICAMPQNESSFNFFFLVILGFLKGMRFIERIW
jgi:hypothetical protein